MFWVLVIPSLSLSLYIGISLLNVRKHDKVLYNFCQIRRDAIAIIDQRGLNFDRVCYHSLRNLIHSLNLVIHEYEGCKVHIFNVRRLLALLKSYKHITHQVDKIVPSRDAEILEIHARFRGAMIRAFLAYTPLIRSEIAAFVLFKLLSFLADRGVKSLRSASSYLGWLVEEMKRHNSPVAN